MLDIRDHLEALDDKGELLTIEEEVDWNLDAAALAAMSNRAGAQAIHFKKVADYPEGFTLAANLFSGPGHYYDYKRTMWGRIAIGLGLDPKIEYEDLISTINERYHFPIKPIKLSSAVCKENILLGTDINVLKFPFPLLHEEDGGRYGFGTVIVKDLDSDWQNWGVYRFMVLEGDRLVADFLSEPMISKDLKTIYKKYAAANKPMPIAIAIGGAPAITLAAAMKEPAGTSEVEQAGGLNLDPINLIKAETSEILVPGDAEIIMEGEVLPNEMAVEGPYGTIKGYKKTSERPVIKVTAITHRNNPVLPFIVDGTKVNDTQAIISITESARLTRLAIEEQQYPVRWVQIPPDFNLGIGIFSIRNLWQGIPFRLSRFIFSVTNLFDKLLFVDADIYPPNLYTTIVDLGEKAHPCREYRVLDGYPRAVMPNYNETEQGAGNSRMYIDACWPAHYTPEEKPVPISFESTFSKDLRDRVLQRWIEEFKIPVAPKPYPEGQR
jgi:4-hydroxy-3-polyprenylbenzoate decarboxylase